MNNVRFLPLFAIIVISAAFAFQGCYTQVVMESDNEKVYEEVTDTTGYAEQPYEDESSEWQPHQYVGFDYYYPTWSSHIWVDPWYQDPWYYDPWYGPCVYPRWPWYPGLWWSAPAIVYWNWSDPYYPYGGYSGYYGQNRWREYTSTATRNSGVRRSSGAVRTEQSDPYSTRGGSNVTYPAGARSGGGSTPALTPGMRKRGTDNSSPGGVNRGRQTTAAPSSAGRSSGGSRRPDVQQQRQPSGSSTSPASSGGSQRTSGGTREQTSSGTRRTESSQPARSTPPPSYTPTPRPSAPSSSPPSYSPPARSTAPSSPPPSSSGGSRREGGSSSGSRR